ncbi:hypothetical protein [Yoonia maritima]|uniref:hypothetical protein n=1 Tax=Yoonia maritima TaxID=1435347 RepID=UPI0037357FDE
MSSTIITDTDNQYSWDSIETTYDEFGQIADRLTAYDNGQYKFEIFDDGVRSRTIQ